MNITSKRAKRAKVMADINITPLTDVVLVLLIIFMVATPMIMQSGIKIRLPQTSVAEVESTDNIRVVIDSGGGIFVDGKNVDLGTLKAYIMSRVGRDTSIVVNADRQVKYDTVVQVLDIARQSGAKKFALATESKKVVR